MFNEKKKPIEINPFIVVGVLIAIVAIVLLVVSIVGFSWTNEFGPETRIDNFESEYSNVPQREKELIFNQLYVAILQNLPEGGEPPSSGAMIREGTAEYNRDEITKVYSGNFIVDIAEVAQSYRIEFNWSSVKNNRYLDGYPVAITCLPRSLQIYDYDGSCEGTIEIDSYWGNAFQIDYVFGNRTSFIIRNVIGGYLIDLYDEEDNYSVLIDADTLKKDKDQPDLTYSFRAALNLEYDFDVIARTDDLYGEEYISVYIRGDDFAKGFILTDNDLLVEELSSWLVDISGDELLEIEEFPLDNY